MRISPQCKPDTQREHTGLRCSFILYRWRVTGYQAASIVKVGDVDFTIRSGRGESRVYGRQIVFVLIRFPFLRQLRSAGRFPSSLCFLGNSVQQTDFGVANRAIVPIRHFGFGGHRPRAPRPSLRQPSWEAQVGKTALGLRGVNFSPNPHSLASRRKQANAVEYFIGRWESEVQPSLQWERRTSVYFRYRHTLRALSASVRSI